MTKQEMISARMIDAAAQAAWARTRQLMTERGETVPDKAKQVFLVGFIAGVWFWEKSREEVVNP